MVTVFFFGDSITFGSGDTMGGWAGRLARDIHSRVIGSGLDAGTDVHNMGIPGDTSTGLAERLTRDTQARLTDEVEPLLVVAIGINDVFSDSRADMGAVLDAYRRNLGSITESIVRLHGSVVFVGLTPVDEKAVSPDTWQQVGHHYRNQDIIAMNDVLAAFCSEQGHPLIAVYDEVVKAGLRRLLGDGLHPNQAGHELIHRLVRGVVLEEIERLGARTSSGGGSRS